MYGRSESPTTTSTTSLLSLPWTGRPGPAAADDDDDDDWRARGAGPRFSSVGTPPPPLPPPRATCLDPLLPRRSCKRLALVFGREGFSLSLPSPLRRVALPSSSSSSSPLWNTVAAAGRPTIDCNEARPAAEYWLGRWCWCWYRRWWRWERCNHSPAVSGAFERRCDLPSCRLVVWPESCAEGVSLHCQRQRQRWLVSVVHRVRRAARHRRARR